VTEVHESIVEAYIACNFLGESTLIIRLFIDLEQIINHSFVINNIYMKLLGKLDETYGIRVKKLRVFHCSGGMLSVCRERVDTER
jgi:hypothetical protein